MLSFLREWFASIVCCSGYTEGETTGECVGQGRGGWGVGLRRSSGPVRMYLSGMGMGPREIIQRWSKKERNTQARVRKIYIPPFPRIQ